MKQLAIIFAGLVVLSGCENFSGKVKEAEKLGLELDSLRKINERNQYALNLLNTVGTYLDSIEAKRQWIRIDLETGINEQDLEERMSSLNDYVSKAEKLISDLEKTRGAYAMQVKRLKQELAVKDQAIEELRTRVDLLSSEKSSLQEQLTMTEDDLYNSKMDIEFKKQELEMIEARIQTLLEATKISEAEGYYLRAEAMEEVANRTQLAPRKKQVALEEAWLLYKKSMSLGNEKAAMKVEALKTKLKKS